MDQKKSRFNRRMTEVIFSLSLTFMTWAYALPDQPGGTGPNPGRNPAENVKTRRIIYNNDGCDAFKPFSSREEFLKRRMTGLENTQVDTVFYCTGLPSWGSYRSSISDPWPDKDHIKQLHAKGEDPLLYVVDFCRTNNLEVFWSLRMNDIHDSWNTFHFSPWKEKHRDLLMAPEKTVFPYGRAWTTMDYGKQAVRAHIADLVRDVAQNYDVDGIELDFNRHDVFFKETMFGLPVTEQHIDQMTSLMREIRNDLDQIGIKKEKRLSISIRTSSSIEYLREIGLDLVRWMEEGLIDIWTPGGFFQLEPWGKSVSLAHRHGVQIYPCLSSRVPAKNIEAWRAEALAVWDAGSDGVYTFNMYNPEYEIYKEIGTPELLKTLPRDMNYDLNVKGAHIRSTQQANIAAAFSFLKDVPGRFLNREILWRRYPFMMDGRKLKVPENYETVKNALAAAQPRDVILIASDHCEEFDGLLFDKQVELHSVKPGTYEPEPGATLFVSSIKTALAPVELRGMHLKKKSGSGDPLLVVGGPFQADRCTFENIDQGDAAVVAFQGTDPAESVFRSCRFFQKSLTRAVLISTENNNRAMRADFINCLIHGSSRREPLLYAKNGADWRFIHCTVVAESEGAILSGGDRGGKQDFINSILYAPSGGTTAVDASMSYASTDHCIIVAEKGYAGYVHGRANDTLTDDAGFAKETGFRLAPGSIAADAGRRLFTPFVPYDIDGQVRDTRPDIGCSEVIMP